MARPAAPQASAQWPLWGGTAHLVVRQGRAGDLEQARAAVLDVVAAVDLACSRFRPDSEVCQLAAAGGRRRPVSPLLADLLAAALRAAAVTGGAVDPTVGLAMVAAGYDASRHLTAGPASPQPTTGPRSAPGGRPVLRRPARWHDVELDIDPTTAAATVRTPPGVLLDLGATAKAMAADRGAEAASAASGCPVLVSLCGDLAVAGNAPSAPWTVAVLERPDDRQGPLVHVYDGGVATSSTLSRSWSRSGRRMHHLLDPATGLPVEPVWRTATVAAASCVEANTASTAAIVKGAGGAAWLTATGLPARLVAADGSVRTVNDWPSTSLERVG